MATSAQNTHLKVLKHPVPMLEPSTVQFKICEQYDTSAMRRLAHVSEHRISSVLFFGLPQIISDLRIRFGLDARK